jgi:hypothetical protein
VDDLALLTALGHLAAVRMESISTSHTIEKNRLTPRQS